MQGRGDGIDPLGAIPVADDLSAQQFAAAFFGQEFDGDPAGIGIIAGAVGTVDFGGGVVPSQRFDFVLLQPGAGNAQIKDLRNGCSHHSRKNFPTSADVDAGHPSLFIGHRAEGDVEGFAANEMVRLDTIPRRPDAGNFRLHAFIHFNAVVDPQRDTRIRRQLRIGLNAKSQDDDVGRKFALIRDDGRHPILAVFECLQALLHGKV